MPEKIWTHLTDAEVQDRAHRLAKTFDEIAELETARKDAAADYKRRIDGLVERQRELAQAVAHRGEFREDTRQRKLFDAIDRVAETGATAVVLNGQRIDLPRNKRKAAESKPEAGEGEVDA